MRMSASSLLSRLGDHMRTADMKVVSEVMGVSLATAYRYRKSPQDMPVNVFERLAHFFNMPVSMNLLYKEQDVVAAEEARLRLEEEIASIRGYRFVTSHHFTANCETDEFARALVEIQYGEKLTESELNNFLELRRKRKNLYFSGRYISEEIINASSYVDFFYGKGVFEGINRHIRMKQIEEVVRTSRLPNVRRKVYSRTTPELPVILNFSTRKSIIRIDDLTIVLTDDDSKSAEDTLRGFANKVSIEENEDVAIFLGNPLNPRPQGER